MSLSPQTREKKKKGGEDPFHSMKRLLIGCMEIFIPNIGCHYFCPGLIALPKNTQNTQTYSSPCQKWRPTQLEIILIFF